MMEDNVSRYMTLLAEVMKNKNTSDFVNNKEKYNKLYKMIHSELNSKLKKSSYPFASDIIKKCEYMMDTMEPFYTFPELIEKKCLLISNQNTTEVFSAFNSIFEINDLATLFVKIDTNIPLIILNTENINENTIEILNYANIRIPLKKSDFEFFMIESGKRKIDLNKIIQCVLVRTTLNDSELCIISDNNNADAEKVFIRAISKKIERINENSASKVKPVLYGFLDEFIFIKTLIIDYYEKQQINAKEILKALTDDIVRLDDKGDQTLQSIREDKRDWEKKIKSEYNDILTILQGIEELVTEICNNYLHENDITGKQIPRYVLDYNFESIFRCKDFSCKLGEKLLSRLDSFDYDDHELLLTYVQVVSGKKETYNAIEIKQDEWEKAKMLLYILEPEEIPKDYLKSYVDIFGERCSTGKELYAKALVSEENNDVELLQESLDKGYEEAGSKLLEKYNNGDRNINIMSLANALIPEACMIVADQEMEEDQNRKKRIHLSDEKLTYYKIAAAKQYMPAIGKIADIFFESGFSNGFQIPKDDLKNDEYKEMLDNGHVICRLCQNLIRNMYKVDHYSEICGIVLFCLNANLSGAMSLLAKADSALAYYCKGNMYEYGGGVAIDLDQAISNYEKAIKKGFINRREVEKRLAACKELKNQVEQQQNSDDYYQQNKSYNAIITKSESERLRIVRENIESFVQSKLKDYQGCFDEALSDVYSALKNGDADGAIAGFNKITKKLGGKVPYETKEEFDEYLNNDDKDIF